MFVLYLFCRPSSAQGKRDSDESPDDDNDVDWSYHVDKKCKSSNKVQICLQNNDVDWSYYVDKKCKLLNKVQICLQNYESKKITQITKSIRHHNRSQQLSAPDSY